MYVGTVDLMLEAERMEQYDTSTSRLKLWKRRRANLSISPFLFKKRRIIGFFPRKYMPNIPVENGSSFNEPITIKIIALTNVIMIETSILLLYPLLYYLIHNPSLLCTSCDNSKICLPSLYKLTEFLPTDQSQPDHFFAVNNTNIKISSVKFVFYWPIFMEVRGRMNSHCYVDGTR